MSFHVIVDEEIEASTEEEAQRILHKKHQDTLRRYEMFNDEADFEIEEAFDDEAEYKNWKETWFDKEKA